MSLLRVHAAYRRLSQKAMDKLTKTCTSRRADQEEEQEDRTRPDSIDSSASPYACICKETDNNLFGGAQHKRVIKQLA